MVEFWGGPTNAIDRCLIEWGLRDWWEIDEALKCTVPPWLIRERIAAFHAQLSGNQFPDSGQVIVK